MHLHLSAILLLLLLSTPNGQAQEIGFEEACGTIGDMTRRADEDVVVEHRGRAAPAVVYRFLACGDVVEVRNGATATVHLADNQGQVIVNSQIPRFKVPGEHRGIANNSYLNKVRNLLTPLFKREKRALPVETIPRAGAPLRHAPFLPDVRQQWTGTVTGVAVLWNGSAERIEVYGRDGRLLRRLESDGTTSAWIVLGAGEPSAAGKVIVRSGPVQAKTLEWELVPVQTPPTAPWLARAPQNDSEQLLWLLWLLDEQPGWRLEAMSRLAALADRSFPAGRIWHAVRAGEIAPN